MLSFQKKLVLLLTLILHSASAFVGSSSSYRRPRRGARGGADQSTIQRTSLAEQSTSTVVLQMAPKKKAAADPETLRKKDIVATISEQLDITKTDADAAVSAVFDAISDIVVEGNRVNVAGFGTFEPRQRSARKGRNPKTGEEIAISASTGCGFSAAKQLKDRLNGKE